MRKNHPLIHDRVRAEEATHGSFSNSLCKSIISSLTVEFVYSKSPVITTYHKMKPPLRKENQIVYIQNTSINKIWKKNIRENYEKF